MEPARNIHLTVPAEVDYLATIRSVVAAMAAHSGLPIPACERARSAAHEAAIVLLQQNPAAPLACDIRELEERLEVRVATGVGSLNVDDTDVSMLLLKSTTDSLTIDQDMSRIDFTILPRIGG